MSTRWVRSVFPILLHFANSAALRCGMHGAPTMKATRSAPAGAGARTREAHRRGVLVASVALVAVAGCSSSETQKMQSHCIDAAAETAMTKGGITYPNTRKADQSDDYHGR